MLLSRRQFFVRERVALVRLTDVYDILDPVSQETVGVAQEDLPFLSKLLRLFVNKLLLPTLVNVREAEGAPPVLSLRKKMGFFRQTVIVSDGQGGHLGTFRSKLWSIGGGFWVLDASGQQVAEVKGDWKGWNFRFVNGAGQELGTVTKKWAGIGKELFTSADNYIIALSDSIQQTDQQAGLLLAAGLAIDTVFKEGR
ncbi:MAG: oxidoreductase [Armatimonadetes bacterium]|nr:oxidoreductase [Armatimonadota bacterium]